METASKLSLGDIVKRLRKARGMSHKQMAAALGVSASTLGNLEHGPYQCIGRKRIEQAISTLGLSSTEAELLQSAWNAAPISPFQEKQRERWDKLKHDRSLRKTSDQLAAENDLLKAQVGVVDAIRTSLREVLLLIAATDPVMECTCAATAPDPCELCTAAKLVGLGRWDPALAHDQLLADLAPPVELPPTVDDFG